MLLTKSHQTYNMQQEGHMMIHYGDGVVHLKPQENIWSASNLSNCLMVPLVLTL